MRRCNAVARRGLTGYDQTMQKTRKFELEDGIPSVEPEDAETLAAIDEGLRDADAGRTTPSEEVRKLLPKWISASNTRKER